MESYAMWKHHYERTVDVKVEDLWPVLADVSSWPSIDGNIDYLTIDEAPASGATFILKPKGGPRLSFTIGDFDPPTRYSDICKMPFAEMHTRHTLEDLSDNTRICVDIEIRGPLNRLWGLMVGRKHAEGLPKQTDRFVAAAQQVLADA